MWRILSLSLLDHLYILNIVGGTIFHIRSKKKNNRTKLDLGGDILPVHPQEITISTSREMGSSLRNQNIGKNQLLKMQLGNLKEEREATNMQKIDSFTW